MEPQNNQTDGEQPENTPSVEPNNPADSTPAAAEAPDTRGPASDTPPPAPEAPAPVASESAPETPGQTLSAPTASTPAIPAVPEMEPVVPTVGAGDVPAQGAVVAGGPGAPKPAGRKRRWLLPVAIVVILVVLLGGGYLFAYYLPNRPSAVYATSLTRSGDAVDALLQYSQNVAKKGYKSYAITGSLNSTGSASYDGTLNGSADSNGDATYKIDVDVMGEKMTANIETVHVTGSAIPDIYVQLTGIKKELDSFGLGSLDSLDGKWIAIDHTLIDSYTAQLDKQLGTQASGLTKSNLTPTSAEIIDAADKVQAVNKQYLFTTDSSKAVLANEKFIGKETKDGRETYHYTVGYNKAHLKAYVAALGTALDSSSLNTWATATTHGSDLSKVLGIQSTETSISHANPGYMFDLWVDAKTKLVHAVTFADPKQPGSTFTLSQNYTGGSTYPFAIHFNDLSGGQAENGSLDIALDTRTDSYKGELTDTVSGGTNVTANFTVTPSKQDVSVTPPQGAEPIMNLLAQFGLNGDNL